MQRCKFPGDFSTMSNDLENFTSNEDIFELFGEWQKEHNKHYQTKEEELKRFEIFKSNLNFIVRKNSKRSSASSYRLGLNQFADLTFEEFSKTHLGENLAEESMMEEAKRMATNNNKMELSRNALCPNAPAEWDWRSYGVVTAVKDQDSCGSCWAFSAVGAIEGLHALTTGTLVSLSEQQLVSCESTEYDGCKGRSVTGAYAYVKRNGGIASSANYPYTAKNDNCNHDREKLIAARIDNYTSVLRNSDDALLCAAARQPVSVLFIVGNDFQHYKSGIMDESACLDFTPCSNVTANYHAMVLVGYSSFGGQDYWIVKNSWGSDWWGDGGYIYIKRNSGQAQGVCNLNCWSTFPVTESFGKLDSAI
ncbi:hypothetical protein K1719_032573 [Acacia pycnantha]|nr:hypothetical protein K1719_045097 [Acacia pycnantha]KAI9085506.1 hypothetical protein K1719_032573 [Acacia pycnantha]